MTRNMYYYDESRIDLSKMREDAYIKSQGDVRNKPVTVVIHYHSHEVPCDTGDYTHEEFPAAEDERNADAQALATSE